MRQTHHGGWATKPATLAVSPFDFKFAANQPDQPASQSPDLGYLKHRANSSNFSEHYQILRTSHGERPKDLKQTPNFPDKPIAANGRATASLGKTVRAGFDPKAQMIAQLGRDQKNISQILQYRDYALETALQNRMNKTRDKVYNVQSTNYNGRVASTGQEESTGEENRVIKSSFNPKSIRENVHSKREVGPRTTIQVPDSLKEAFNKRGQPDNFSQLMMTQSELLSPRALQKYSINAQDFLNRTTKNRTDDISLKSNFDKEYVIKNYRLVYQKKKDFFLPTAKTPAQRGGSLTPIQSEQEPGIFATQTPIRVSNSILTPNTFHFSTKVTLGRKLKTVNDQIEEEDTSPSKTEIGGDSIKKEPPPSAITAELRQLTFEEGQKIESPRETKYTYLNLLKSPKSPPQELLPEKSPIKLSPAPLNFEVSPLKEQEIPIIPPLQQSPIAPTLQDQPIRIIDTQRTDVLFEQPSSERAHLIEMQFQDLVASWLTPPIRETINPDDFVASDGEDDIDMREMLQSNDRTRKVVSEIRLYDLTRSYDSIEVEKQMITTMKTNKEEIRRQAEEFKGTYYHQVKEPYAHLKARNVLAPQMKEFNRQIELTMQSYDNRQKAKVMISLSNDFLTHLDHSHFTIDRLPLEIFDDFLLEADSIKSRIQERYDNGQEPLHAYTQYFRTDGSIEEVVCKVLDFDESRRKFVIAFNVDDKFIKKYQGRLNLIFLDFDSREAIQQRRELAIKLRRNTLFKLNAERLFVQELAKKYDYIDMPQSFKNQIKSRLAINLSQFSRERVEVLTLQVEALFVFSILKSIIYSQLGDPYISRIVAHYKIEEMTVTRQDIKDEISDYQPLVPFYALKAYEDQEGKMERMISKKDAQKILQDYSIIGKKSFILIIQYLMQLNEELVAVTPLFQFPITDSKIYVYLQSQEDFKGKSINEMSQRISEFPVQMHNFVKSQKALSKRFKDLLEGRWTENIARKVEEMLDGEYGYEPQGREIQRNQLNPFIQKLFEFIKLFQEKILLEKLMVTTDAYLKFLLSFAIRDKQFQTRIYDQSPDMQSYQVRMSSKPLITVEVRIKRIIAGGNKNNDDKDDFLPPTGTGKYSYEVQTKPAMDDIWTDLSVMIDLFISSVSRIRRIDDMVIPSLKLKKNTLMHFEKNKNPSVVNQIKHVTNVIEAMRVLPEQKIQQLKDYQPYLEMTYESVILDLKQKTFAEQNQTSGYDIAENEEDDDESQLGVDAYKDIEISEKVYIQSFAELRKTYWDIQLEIQSQYDFGIIVLECSSFKKSIVKHIESILKQLQDSILKDFLISMNHLYSQYDMVEKRVNEKAVSIDDVILLLEFIENIQRPEDLLDELEAQLEELKIRKIFIDDLYLHLKNADFEKYLHLFSFPSRLRLLLVKRRFNLESEREVLSAQMQEEKDRVLKALISYRDCFDFFKKVGLYRPGQASFRFPSDQFTAPVSTEIEEEKPPAQHSYGSKNANVIMKKKLANDMKKQEAEKKRQLIMCMVDDQGNQFVPQYITENSARMEKLKLDLDQTEADCEIINRREKLLNFRQTKFTAVGNLKQDMTPFITLWSIASSFTKTYESWLFGVFAELDSDKMDESLMEWIKQLVRISKTALSTYPQPMTLVNYLLRELERFKDYMPMIAAMRSKGLEKRHWSNMGKHLEGIDTLDQTTLSLATLIEMRLFEGPKLDIIKSVSEVAMKEWAIKTTLDGLENDLKNIDFTLIKYKEPAVAIILKGLDELMAAFEDFTVKTVSLKQNTYAKVFTERILKIEKEFKAIVDVLDEWIKVQKSWIYLEPIFSQKDIADSMRTESVKFASLDQFFKKEIHHIQNDPNVHKYCRRETILNSLQYANKEFELITKGLTVYLEAKRSLFSRFYFLSNEEILEILGQIRDPKSVQKFLNKIFEGIDGLTFNNGMIQGITSKEDELLPLKRFVDPSQNAESWLRDLEAKMKEAVQNVIENAYADYRLRDLETWVKSWQGQAVLVVLNIILTDVLTEIFNEGQIRRLKDALNQIVYEIETLTKLIRTKLPQNVRTSICSLLINRVHSRDTLKNMLETDARYAQDFSWKLFMKYEYSLLPKKSLIEELRRGSTIQPKPDGEFFGTQDNEDAAMKAQRNFMGSLNGLQKQTSIVQDTAPLQNVKHLCVSIIDAKKPYGYEYLGNSQRLVITPLTDRCFRALFMALHFNYGGSPEGPVGTGKTETTKDLSKCLGKQCFVFNCSSSLNYESMSKFFKGLATCGAWSCFDEFNRIELSVLSVISQIIIVMQGAIRESKTEMVFEDTPIKFNKECAIFITMNPQFLGRTDLPDNLKSLFRPVAMIIPDSTLISEISLYSYGFLQAKPLARKLVRAFRLAKQQLSNQIHYEFGLRSIKIVLQIAGLMKLKASGVIETEFKFKEGRKSKNDHHQSTYQLTSQNHTYTYDSNFNKSLDERLSRNDRAAYLAYRGKHEQSLDSNVCLRRKRQPSLDSEDYNINDDLMLREIDLAPAGRKLDDLQKELKEKADKEARHPDERLKQLKIKSYRVSWRGMDKFTGGGTNSRKRGRLARGNIVNVAEKRMQPVEDYKEAAKLTKKLMKVLGINDIELIKDEEKIEEFIVLRAINDTNVPKLHQNDTMIFKGIIDDIFPTPIKQSIERNSLKALLDDITQTKSMQLTDEIMERILHLSETVMIRHGVMVVGSTMTGKTTIIQLLQECLNKSRENEIEERILDFKMKKARKIFLHKLTRRHPFAYDDHEVTIHNEEDIAKGIDLTFEETRQIRAQCRNKGVATFTINPKCLTIDQLMGYHDNISKDWTDGVMAHAMRVCAQDTSEKRNWIIFDGPIDTDWVENLNSVLDDNKKLTLSTGECIKLTGQMTVILEAEDLTNSTPATISRCGMIYLRDDILPLKGILNQWIKKLPEFLEDTAQEIDLLCNYFIPDILEKYMNQQNLIYPVTRKWAIKNFCRMMDSLIYDYRSDKFAQLNSMTSAQLAVYLNPGTSGHQMRNSHEGGLKHNDTMQTITTITGVGNQKKPFNLSYADIESRFSNAIKNKTMWIQNFFLFSLIWSFGSILKLELRSDFEQHLRAKIVCNTEDINSIAQFKSKFEKKKQAAASPNVPGRGGHQRNQAKLQNDTDLLTYQVTFDFKHPDKTPYFFSTLPEGLNLFDMYFDLESNQWYEWESLKVTAVARPVSQDDNQNDNNTFKKQSSVFTKFIHTIETIRLGYLLETAIVAKSNLMLIGPTGCGKSWLIREMMFKQIPLISQKYKTFSMVFSNSANADKAQSYIDSRLEKRRKGVYGPPMSQKYVFFIDDLMMPYKDRFGTQSANELIRQWFDFNGWYDTKTLEIKRVDDIQFLSCITTYDSSKSVISTRNEWHWSYLGAVNMSDTHYVNLFTQILDSYSQNWPLMVASNAPLNNCVKATLELYEFFEKSVKPTPNKFLYYFNVRHMFKIIYGITEVDASYMVSDFHFGKLWIHESWRTLCDRICDNKDAKIINKKLRELAKKYFDPQSCSYSKEIGKPFFTYYNKGSEGLYLEATTMSETANYLKRFLYDYNELHKKQKIDVVLFTTMIEFLLKVLRMIKQPFSHGILIGIEGSGKEPLCRLATSLANFNYYTIKFDANYAQDEWQQDLKNLILMAGIDMKEVVFQLKHNQIIKESFLDDLNTLVNNGEIQNLFSKEEYDNIVVQVSTRLFSVHKKTALPGSAPHSDEHSASGHHHEHQPPKTPTKPMAINSQLCLGDFSQKCRENLKVILNFTPTGANLRQRLRDHKQLLNCSTVIWMEKWPSEGYKEVASILLPVHEDEDTNEFALLKDKSLFKRDDVVSIAMKIHHDAIALSKDYFFETQHYLHITPQLFQDFLKTYKILYIDKTNNLTEIRSRYEMGLQRLKSTQEQVEKFSAQLESNSPLLIDKQIEIEKILDQLRDDHENLGRLKEMLIQEDQQLVVQKEQAEYIRQECEVNLQRATPDLYSAISNLQSLSKYELNELKNLRNPPKAIKILMECICLLLQVEPLKVKAKDGVTIEKDYWTAAIGKNVLGNSNIIQTLSEFDSSKINANIMSSLEWKGQNPEFTIEQVENASKAAKGLYQWLQAIKNYYYVYQEILPKRDALFLAEKQMLTKQQEITVKRQEIVDLQKNLNHLKERHKVLQGEVNLLQKQIDECSVKKDRAGRLLNGLGGEKQKWLVCNRMIDKRFVTIQGDVLLGAAFITYLSPFTQKFRERSVDKWAEIIAQYGISIQDSFTFNRVFGDPIKIKEWNFNGLPSDSFSIQNAIVLEKATKQPICIDPQYQASKWIKQQDTKELKVLNFNDGNFVQNLEFAVKFGKRVLIENIGQKVDLVVYPLIKKEFTVEAGQTTVSLYGRNVEVDSHFKLYILSEMKNPRFGPDISVLTTQVNFHVTIEGLEEQMLSIVISSQKSELEEESIKMRKEALQCIKILKELEEKILDSLSNDIETILSDAKLIETLQTSKKTSRQIGENLNKVNRAQAILLKSRGMYTPAAYRAALLYFLVSDISKIEYMYQFSLKWYIDVFTEEIQQKKTTDQDPLLDIIRNFTFTFYRKVCQSIFEKDKLLFTLLLALRILQGENCLDEKLFEFFLKGFQIQTDLSDEDSEPINLTGALEDPVHKKKSQQLLQTEAEKLRARKKEISWITDSQWQTLERLSKIAPFDDPSIVRHVLDNQEQWYAYANAKDGDNVAMPGVYVEYDPVKKEKLMKKMKKQQQEGKRQRVRSEAESEGMDETNMVLEDDELWELDDKEDEFEESTQKSRNNDGEEEQEVDDRDQIADSIVMGVSDFQEFRYGSVRYERELQNRKQQVLKDLIRFCVIRIFTPEKLVREIQRFLGSVLDPRFMEPPVFNLPQFYQESSCHTPILFIQSSNTNVLNELNILKLQINEPSLPIEYLPLGGNVGEKVTQLIMKCAINGSWLLLENLHLVTSWIPTLEKFIQELNKEDKKSAASGQKYQNNYYSPVKRSIQNMPKVREAANSQGIMFPELVGVRINPKFRLWLSSMPVDYFPVSFIQDCVKLTLQPAQGIRQNTLKLLNSTSLDYLQRCPERQAEFRKLYFSLTVFHSVVVERQRFGPLGFSGHAYQFSENDFIISSLQLQYLLSRISTADEPLPLDLARYLIGTLNYGGRIVKQQDEITLNAILDTFLNEKTASEQNYRLTGLDTSTEQGIYYIPGDGDIGHYKQFIIKFPVQDRAEIFGLHKNAIVQRMSNEGKTLLERVFEFEFASKEVMKASAILESNDVQVGENDSETQEDKAVMFKRRIVRIMKELPDLLDEKTCIELYPISYDHCFNILIKKEVERYNTLMQVIYITLKNTLKALEGVMHINPQLEEVYRSLTYEHVPEQWFRYSYPAFKSLSLYLTNLKDRVEFIRSFLTTSRRDLNRHLEDYWLPGFFDQQGFFTTLLQQKARNDKVSIEQLAIDFKAIKPKELNNAKQNGEGCLIHGLWLEAAKWQDIDENLGDKEPITLQDSNEGYGLSLYQMMPHFQLRVVTQTDFDSKYSTSKFYHCPMYMIGLRDRLESGIGADTATFSNSMIIKVPLYIGSSGVPGAKGNVMRQPGFWIKRGTALLCHKED